MTTASDSLLGQFLERELSLSGKLYSDADKARAAQLAADELATLMGRQHVFVSEADPLVFGARYFALLDAGMIPVPVPADIHPDQLSRLEARAPRALPLHPQTYACLTSGTTSEPKLCYLSVDGARAVARAHCDSLGMNSSSIILQSLPVYHSFGLVCYLWAALILKCRLDFNPAFLNLRALSARKLQNATLHISPAQLRYMLKEKPQAIHGLSTISVGGGLADPSELEALKARLPSTRIFVSYGLTEAGPRVTTGEITRAFPSGFIGHAMPGIELRVRDSQGILHLHGEGHLCVRTPGVKLNLLPSEVQEGFLITRDRVSLTPENGVVFLSREDDIIKVGGVSVYPKDIEELAREFSGASDCLVLKQKDPLYEEVPVLFVETEAAAQEVEGFLKERLPPVQMPRRIFTLRRFPRQSLNKVNRRELERFMG